MAPMDKISSKYLDDSFFQEAKDFGGMHFSPQAEKMGFSAIPENLRASMDAFAAQVRPDTGQPLLRKQKNASSNFDCVILTPQPSVRVLLSSMSEEQKQQKEAILLDAYKAAAEHISQKEEVRRGAGGTKREQAEGLYFIAMHGSTRSQNPQSCDHAHVVFANAAITQEGKTYSVAGENRIKLLKEADLIFNLKLAEGLEKKVGIRCEIQNGRCEVPGVSQQAIDQCTGAKAKEITQKIQDAGVENTPRNRRLANDILRKDAPKYNQHDGKKLQKEWREKAQQIQPTILSDAKLQKNQRQDTMQRLAELQMPQGNARQSQQQMNMTIGQKRQAQPKGGDPAAAASAALLQKTQKSQSQQDAAQRRNTTQPLIQKMQEKADQAQVPQRRPQEEKKQQHQQQRAEQQKARRRPFEASDAVKNHNQEEQRQRKDFLKKEKSWLAQQTQETIKTAKAILKARFQGERKIIKVRDFAAFQEQTRKRSIAEGHRAAREAVRSTRVKSFKHALEVAQQGYKEGRKPKMIPPKGTHVFLAEKMKLTLDQKKHLAQLQQRHNLKIHQGQQRNIQMAQEVAREIARQQEAARRASS